VIYFLLAKDLGLLKIGFSRRPERRISSLICASPVRLKTIKIVDGDAEYEKSLHRKFSTYRAHGEWFYYNPEIELFIQALEHQSLGDIDRLQSPTIISMKTEEAVKRFGSKYRLAQILGITRQAVGQWGDNVPELQALKLEKASLLERDAIK